MALFRTLSLRLVFFLTMVLMISMTQMGCNFFSKSQGEGQSKGPAKGAGAQAQVTLAIWSNYLVPELLQEFEKETGIQVQVFNYSSNEELLAKLQAGVSEYDVIVPTDYMIHAMIQLGLLHELDYSLLPHAKGLDPKYLKQKYDPTNRFSVPYDWGTTGIAVNRSLYSGTIRGWKDLLTQEDLAGKFSLLDDVREVLGIGLKAQGFSLNSRDPGELKKSAALVKKAKNRIKAFTSEPITSIVQGEVAVAQMFSSDALQARKTTGGKIDYFIPVEGGTVWIDNLAISKRTNRQKEAHALMNFLLKPTTSRVTVEKVWVGPANRETFALLPADLKANGMLFPPEELLKKSEMIEDVGDALILWDQAWTEIKAY